MRPKWLIIIAGVMLVGAFAATFAVRAALAPPQESLRALRVGRQNWQAQNISHYRLKLRLSDGFTTDCVHEVEVRNEQVLAVLASTCHGQQMNTMALEKRQTLSQLFDEVAYFAGKYRWMNNEGCTYFAPEVAYDERWGFPQHFQAIWTDAPLNYRILMRFKMRHVCNAIGTFVLGWDVQEFEPLP